VARVPRRAPLYALYAADTISLAGNAVAQLAIPWYVLTTTGSATLTGLAVFFNFLPAVIAAFFGGVVVDRLGFRVASIVADLASSGAVAAIPLLHATVGIELWQLMALVFLGALLDAPGATARAALLPDAVELAGVPMERASGIRGAIQQGAQLLGAPVGGILVATVGATAALWIDAASFLVSAALVAFLIPRARRGESEQRGRFWEELGEGLRFIRDRPLVRALVAMVLLSNLFEAPGTVVLTVFAEQEYDSAAALGLMLGVLGGTALAGALAYSAVGHRLPRRRTFLWCFAFVPVGYLALATLPSLPVALVALAVMGFAAGPINPLLFTVMTEIVPAHLRGRAFGAVRAGAWASIPLGILLGSAMVAVAGVAATLLTMGTLLAALVAYSFFNPAFREMDVRPSAGDERRDEAVSA
jgi:predicted MFS family arabinose efflux permease